MAEQRPSNARVAEAADIANSFIKYAYEQGMHEVGIDPVKVLTDEIERLQRQVDELSIHAEKWVRRALDRQPVSASNEWNTPWRASGFAVYDANGTLVAHTGITGNRTYGTEQLERMATMIVEAVNRVAVEPSVVRDALEAIAAPSRHEDYGWWTQVARRALGYATKNETAQPPPATPLREVVQAVVDWNTKYPSSRIYDETSIRRIAAEMDVIFNKAKAALAAYEPPKADQCEVCKKPLPPIGAWSMPSCPECQELLEGLGEMMADFADREQTIKADWIGRAINLICARAPQPPAATLPEYTHAIGDAAETYLKSRGGDPMFLPGGFFWMELWNAMCGAAVTKEGAQ